MSSRTLILLPPSEGKAEGGSGPPWEPGAMTVDLDEHRGEVLTAADGADVAGGGVPGPVAAAATMPAIERYRGVLYDELDAATIRGVARRRLNSRVLIVSGLWGLVAPKDPIPFYKLKMSASVPPLGRLSTWWRPAITGALAARAHRATVWDLLPNEHSAAIDWTSISPRRRITIRFLDRNGRTVSHWNKLLKGSIVRWLAETGETDPDALGRFEHPRRYRLDPDATVVDGTHTGLVLREAPEAGA